MIAGTTPVLVHNDGGPGWDGVIDGQDAMHIIFGDANGGGHKWPGNPGKTSFPPDWDTDQILNSVADVATDPASSEVWQQGRAR